MEIPRNVKWLPGLNIYKRRKVAVFVAPWVQNSAFSMFIHLLDHFSAWKKIWDVIKFEGFYNENHILWRFGKVYLSNGKVNFSKYQSKEMCSCRIWLVGLNISKQRWMNEFCEKYIASINWNGIFNNVNKRQFITLPYKLKFLKHSLHCLFIFDKSFLIFSWSCSVWMGCHNFNVLVVVIYNCKQVY